MKKVATIFKGVHAGEFIHYLLSFPSSYLTDATIEALSGEGSFGDIKDHIESLLEGSETEVGSDVRPVLESVLKWPTAFIEALTTAYEHVPLLVHSKKSFVSNSIAASLGTDVDLLHDLVLLHGLHRAEQKKRNKGPTFDEAIDVVCRGIRLVLSKIPDAHAYRLEDLHFCISNKELLAISPGCAPKLNPQSTDTPGEQISYYVQDYARDHYSITLSTLSEFPHLQEKDNAEGSFFSGLNLVVIYKWSVETIAHEVGHALWHYSYSPRLLTTFLLNTSVQAGTRAKTARDFVNRISNALEGIELNESLRTHLVHNLEAGWGADYADKFKDEKDNVRLRKMLTSKSAQDEIKRVVKRADRTKLLSAWGEAWAEGFAEILFPGFKSRAFDVPHVILSLIRHLLALGTSHAD